MKLKWIVNGAILILIFIPTGIVGYSGNLPPINTEIPACDSGISFLDACDSAIMVDEGVTIPAAAASLMSADINIEWGSNDVWVGIVSAEYADQCIDSGNGYLVCDTENLEFKAGGPDADGALTWSMEGGDLRAVVGNSLGGEKETVNVEITYNVKLTPLLAYGIGIFGIVSILLGIRAD
ncbi:MAG TPA: hypothetical protein QF555_02780 [Candidatus Thalassarchaeaceae archaeon]|nr:hypothetical protein [Candidatus Thalassarchaeaceae archaeon]